LDPAADPRSRVVVAGVGGGQCDGGDCNCCWLDDDGGLVGPRGDAPDAMPTAADAGGEDGSGCVAANATTSPWYRVCASARGCCCCCCCCWLELLSSCQEGCIDLVTAVMRLRDIPKPASPPLCADTSALLRQRANEPDGPSPPWPPRCKAPASLCVDGRAGLFVALGIEVVAALGPDNCDAASMCAPHASSCMVVLPELWELYRETEVVERQARGQLGEQCGGGTARPAAAATAASRKDARTSDSCTPTATTAAVILAAVWPVWKLAGLVDCSEPLCVHAPLP
jgi:hypothetical protein